MNRNNDKGNNQRWNIHFGSYSSYGIFYYMEASQMRISALNVTTDHSVLLLFSVAGSLNHSLSQDILQIKIRWYDHQTDHYSMNMNWFVSWNSYTFFSISFTIPSRLSKMNIKALIHIKSLRYVMCYWFLSQKVHSLVVHSLFINMHLYIFAQTFEAESK